MHLSTLVLGGFSLAFVLCHASEGSSESQNHEECDPRAYGEAICQSVSLLQTGSVRHVGKDHGHKNNNDHDHDENSSAMAIAGKETTSSSSMAIKEPAPDPVNFKTSRGLAVGRESLPPDQVALQLAQNPFPNVLGPDLPHHLYKWVASGAGWQVLDSVNGNRENSWFPIATKENYPQSCESKSNLGVKKKVGWRGIPVCQHTGDLTLDQAKQICQSMNDCKAIQVSWYLKSPNVVSNCNFFKQVEKPLGSNGRLQGMKQTVVIKEEAEPKRKPAENDSDNENFGPDLGEKAAKDLLDNLQELSESARKKLENVATKDDLKKVVHHIQEHFEEQMAEAGKHILENRKYLKHVNDILGSILKSRSSSSSSSSKSGSSRRRRRR